MSTTSYPHISIDAEGTPRIGQTRYKVLHLAAEHFHYGWSAEELLRQHPDLRPEEVYASLTYFYDHHAEMLQQIQAEAANIDSLKSTAPFSREELLRRRKLAD